jgi:2-oxoglutarate ferredoxin oxidoreductase subunit alpha
MFLMGSGGDGVITAGDLLAKAAAHDGLNCHLTKSFGPQIRGGESAAWLQMGTLPVRAPADAADAVLVLAWRSYPVFQRQLRLAPGSVVVQDAAEADLTPEGLVDTDGQPANILTVPFKEVAESETGTHLARNVVAIGFLSALYGLPWETMTKTLEKRLAKKGAQTVAANIRAFDRGQELARDERFAAHARRLAAGDGNPRLLLTGNDAVAMGALYAGVEFFAGYPITPATEVLQALAAQLPGAGGTVVQAEDEIASMSMVIGASFGGKKSMTATSGPGLSLKTEAIGLAAHAELPAVILDVQRGGPSTGMPTKTEQSDLQLAVYGAHGDGPKVVIAAEDVKTCFDATVKAFYIAEKYQTPVLLMSDQQIGHREEALPADAFEEGNAFRKVTRRKLPDPASAAAYKRFDLSADPITAISHPGMKGFAYRTSGIIHREDGSPTSDGVLAHRMSEKIERKLALVLDEFEGVRTVGPEDARQGLLVWGSTAGAAIDAAERLTARGQPTSVLVVELVYPLPVERIRAWTQRLDRYAIAELSFSGQFARFLRSNGLLDDGVLLINRAGGAAFTPGELLRRIKESWT